MAQTRVAKTKLDLAARLKALRTQKKLSLRALAEHTGFSPSFLSQVELGQASPSLASLGKIAQALGLSLSELLAEEQPPHGPVLRRKDAPSVRSQWSKATVQSLLPAGARERVGAVLISMEPGGRSGKLPAPATGTELAFCVRGQVRLTLNERQYDLSEGDSIYYDASQPLLWENPESQQAELIVVMMAPDQD